MKITGALYDIIETAIHAKLQEIVTDLRIRTDSLQNKQANKESYIEYYVYNNIGNDPKVRAMFDLYYMSKHEGKSLNECVCSYKSNNNIRDINDSHILTAVKKAFSSFNYKEEAIS